MEYTPELGEKIATMIASGATLATACRQLQLDERLVKRWLYVTDRDNQSIYEDLSAKLTRARPVGLDSLAESLLTIYDDEPDVAKARGKSENIKWLVSRLAPAKYGDKLQVDVSGQVDIQHAISVANSRLERPVFTQIPHQQNETVIESDASGASATDYQSVAPVLEREPEPHIDAAQLLGADEEPPAADAGAEAKPPSLEDLLG